MTRQVTECISFDPEFWIPPVPLNPPLGDRQPVNNHKMLMLKQGRGIIQADPP